jgi:hypothetical protein
MFLWQMENFQPFIGHFKKRIIIQFISNIPSSYENLRHFSSFTTRQYPISIKLPAA